MPRKPHLASSTFSAYLELVKPRIMLMVLVTTFFGFYLASRGQISAPLLVFTLFGVALVKGGAATLNHFLERDTDALMERTKLRPIPSGMVSPANALAFGIILTLAGVGLLAWKVNLLTAFLGLLTAFLYVLVYTPLKRITWLNTRIGAIPGALPAMGGWAAATNSLSAGAWVLFAILFFWQHPHFYSIAILYKDEYKKAGLVMLPGLDSTGKRTFHQVLFHSILLILVSILPVVLGLSGKVYLIGVLLIGFYYAAAGLPLGKSLSVNTARRLLRVSVLYLPVMMILIIADIQI